MATKTSVVLLDEKKKPAASSPAGYMERESTRCFKLGSILFVPTYVQSKMGIVEYVGPSASTENSRRFTELELRRMGAHRVSEFLWKRAWIDGR